MSSEDVKIVPYDPSMRDAIVRLSLRAWAPVFDSMKAVMLPEVYHAFFGDDWRAAQQRTVEAACADPNAPVFVAKVSDEIAGYAALRLHAADRMGEVYMIAVDPDFQRRGVSLALTSHALQFFKSAGMTIAMVETGGDPGHGPARRAYEAAGFQLLPVARYFKAL